MFGRSRAEVAAHARDWAWWRRGLARSLVALLIVAVIVGLPIQVVKQRYRIAFDVSDPKCLPYTAYLLDMGNRAIGRGDYVAFVSGQMEPYIENGHLVVKILAGLPLDRAVVAEEGVTIGGRDWGALHYLEPGGELAEEGKTIEDYARTEIIREGTYWMMGTLKSSYDSRYWGAIEEDQIVGKAYPIF